MQLEGPGGDTVDRAEAWIPFLRVGLAAAAGWHLLGNAFVADGAAAVLVGVGAAAVALQPRNRWVFVAFTLAVWISIWQEAPLLGNHWLLAGFVAAAVSLASFDRRPASPVFAAQAVVVTFYAFAAFAKLNADFFDPETSCATFYAGDTVSSLGVDVGTPVGAKGYAVILAVALVELLIPALLVLRRTRVAGAALAILFHVVVALDHRHQFFDFSSVLVVVFLTFLPGALVAAWSRHLAGPVRSWVVRGAAAALAVVAALVTASDVDPDTPFELGYASWSLVALVVVPSVAVVAWRHRQHRSERRGVPTFAVPVVVLAVVVGLSPYLELKTGAAWNMYANLRTVDGDSNHFIVRSSLPLGSAHDDLVQVLEGDGVLATYVDSGLRLPRRQLRYYLQTNPAVGGTIRVGDQQVTFLPGEIPDALGDRVPEVIGRLAVLRAVRPDDEPVPCQDSYLPAT